MDHEDCLAPADRATVVQQLHSIRPCIRGSHEPSIPLPKRLCPYVFCERTCTSNQVGVVTWRARSQNFFPRKMTLCKFAKILLHKNIHVYGSKLLCSKLCRQNILRPIPSTPLKYFWMKPCLYAHAHTYMYVCMYTYTVHTHDPSSRM